MFLTAIDPDDLPLSPGQMEEAREELRKRNITEEELIARLEQKGVDLDNIPPEELPAYQGIIMDTINELEAEKRAAETAEREKTGPPSLVRPAMVTPAMETIEQEVIRPQVVEEPSPEEERRMIYGHEPFTKQEIKVFRTTEGARAPDTYILGPGDQIRITIFGDSQADMLLEINSEGYIQPVETPQIYLKGLTITQARNMLSQRLSQFYSFRSDQFALTIQTARTITVNIFGESQQKGSFTMSALNMLLERSEVRPQAKTDLIFVERIQPNESVRSDIERTLQFDERIRLEDALSLAGGINPTAADT